MPTEKDMDDPVNVDLEPEEALRLLLGTKSREPDEKSDRDADEDRDADAATA